MSLPKDQPDCGFNDDQCYTTGGCYYFTMHIVYGLVSSDIFYVCFNTLHVTLLFGIPISSVFRAD